MRVLHVTGTYLPVKGGGPYYIHYLSKYLEDMGHDCLVVTTDMGGEIETETTDTLRSRSVEVAGAPMSPTYPFLLYKAVKKFDPDVIHGNYPLPLYPDIGLALSKISDVPFVLTCHGSFENSLESVAGVVGTCYNNTVLRATLRLSDCIHMSNHGIPSEIQMYQGYREKTEFIPIGVDTDWFDPRKVDKKREVQGECEGVASPYRKREGEHVVLYVGSFRRYKGLEYLVRAFEDMGSDSNLVLIGDRPRKNELENLASELGVSDRVEFHPHVSDAELRRAYRYADVFVLPSPSILESLGMVAMEAMAMEIPTVVTRGSGIGHVLEGEDVGCVVEPHSSGEIEEKVSSLLEDEDTRKRRGKACRKYVVDNLSWDYVIDDYIEMYRELTGGQD